jgi:hypothetical protein
VTGTSDTTITQNWGGTQYYQVKAFSTVGGTLSTSWASIAVTTPAQPTTSVGGTPWLNVAVGAEPLYTLNVTNNVAKNTWFTLWYRGASGTGTRVQVGSSQKATKVGDAVSWSGLHAGPSTTSYELTWGTNGVADGPVAGANLTVNINVPVTSPW